MRTFILLASLALAGALFVACGGDEPTPNPTATATQTQAGTHTQSPLAPTPDAERARRVAEAALLSIDDFPAGWSERPDDTDSDHPCGSGFENQLAIVYSGDFVAPSGSFPEATAAVVVFATSEEVQAVPSITAARVQCQVDRFNDGKEDSREARYSDASVSRLSFAIPGDTGIAHRISVRATARDGRGSATFYADQVIWTRGEVAVLVQLSDILTAPSIDLLEQLVAKADEKLQAALASQ